LEYTSTILDYLFSQTLKVKYPIQSLTGTTPDIIFCLYFRFWEPIYFHITNEEIPSSFPSSSNERSGRWIGFGDSVGDTLTWKILTNDDNTVIYRSSVRSTQTTTPKGETA
jgi:hypothetical protein